MEVKINKQSFYNTLEELFNHLYHYGYVKHVAKIEPHKYRKIDKDYYQCEIEEHYLETEDGKKILYDGEITKATKKAGFYTLETKEWNNDNFTINDTKNEIIDLIMPYILEYPFLINIPTIIENFKEEGNDSFNLNDEELIILKEALKDFKTRDDYNKKLFLESINGNNQELKPCEKIRGKKLY